MIKQLWITKKTWRIPPYEVKYHSIIVSEIRFCVKTCAAMLSKWTSPLIFIIQEDIFPQQIDITPIGLAQHPLNLLYPVAWKDLHIICIFRFNFVHKRSMRGVKIIKRNRNKWFAFIIINLCIQSVKNQFKLLTYSSFYSLIPILSDLW